MRIAELTQDVREFIFHCLAPDALSFRAGQYVSLVIPPREKTTREILRAYSLMSTPHAPSHFRLLANLVPGGVGSTYLFNLPMGSLVQFRGPKGHFCLDDCGTRDYMLLADGTGIAPLYEMIAQLCAAGSTRRIICWWQLANEQDIYYRATFLQWATMHANFSFDITLTTPSAAWTGSRGPLAELIATRIDSVRTLDVYACGSGTMIESVKTILRTKGLCPVHVEKYY